MLVSVTGGTGFGGSHTVAELARSGHHVRLLVRDEARVERALTPLGVDFAAIDVQLGDITDAVSVASFVKGADAVLHAAAVYSFDARRTRELRRTNVTGTDTVLQAARRAGVGSTVYVSSIVALAPSPAGTLHPSAPVSRPRETYAASKAAAERLARDHQASGAPVIIAYPPALLGPHDPHLGDQTARLRNTLRGLLPVWPTGGFTIGDVRDTARLLADLAGAGGTGPGRYVGPGHFLSTRRYVEVLRDVTGRALPTAFLPASVMLPLGRAVSMVQRIWPWHIPAEYGAIYTCAQQPRTDRTAPNGGVHTRPIATTVADTVRWLHASDLLSHRQAGIPLDTIGASHS